MRRYEHIKPYLAWREPLAAAKYLLSGRYMTESIYTEKLERILANYLKVPYVSMVPNGTSALYLSLLAAGVGKGDKVIVPDYTMIATANAVRMAGAEPVLVDINIDGCMDITKAPTKAKALIYVEINGYAGDLRAVVSFCRENNITLIEDSCQALGSEYLGKKLGSFGRFAAFSTGFHKIITTGQGGFIVSHTKRDYETIERLKDFGRITGGNDTHDYLGYNFKFTDLQAVIGIEQMKTIEWRVAKKRKLYEWYFGHTPRPGYVPWFIEWNAHSRDKMYTYLKQNGIATRKLYPPIHTQKIYRRRGKFPVATKVSKGGLWLPSSLSLKQRDVEYIKNKIHEGTQRHTR